MNEHSLINILSLVDVDCPRYDVMMYLVLRRIHVEKNNAMFYRSNLIS